MHPQKYRQVIYTPVSQLHLATVVQASSFKSLENIRDGNLAQCQESWAIYVSFVGKDRGLPPDSRPFPELNFLPSVCVSVRVCVCNCPFSPRP